MEAHDGFATFRFRSLADAERLTELISQNLPPARKATVRLTAALAAAGCAKPDGISQITATNGIVDLGHLDVLHALRLWALLGAGPAADRFDPEQMDWQTCHDLAHQMNDIFRDACNGPVSITADPACSTCTSHRPDRIALGFISAAQALHLAGRIEAATA
ncbi:hypothetical protein [Streptomyces sp. NPDC056061]|uniref:hypothetical protein n=1 Tax=Streptomyces sp. NPDC056061 TaxID=3345700 RepID=UPI0035DBEA7E